MSSGSSTILVCDDSIESIDILKHLLTPEFRLLIATNGEEAIAISKGQCIPELILLDINMPGINGYEVLKRLKANVLTQNIPVIFVTSYSESVNEEFGLKLGAVDYISKPFNSAIVLARIRNHLALHNQQRELESQVKKRTEELLKTKLEIIHQLGKASEYRDNETGMHVIRISYYAQMIAQKLGLEEKQCTLLHQAAPLHDIGKIGIPDAILLKNGKLTPDEWEVMKTHTTMGNDILGDTESEVLVAAKEIALYHHEKWDGSGYPDGISGESIPLFARICAIADVFDALTSARPYKKAWSNKDAFAFIKEHIGSSFDPKLAEIFVENADLVEDIQSRFKDKQLF